MELHGTLNICTFRLFVLSLRYQSVIYNYIHMNKILNIGYYIILVLAFASCGNDNEETVGSFLAQELETQEWSGKVASEYNGGTGTQSDPYQIATGSQLALLGKSMPVNKYYVLTQDINLMNIVWTPINLNSSNFDGANHTIKGLTTKSGSSLSALFSNTSGTICNLNINDATITPGKEKTAVLCAEINEGTVRNCTVCNARVVSGTSSVGGGIAATISGGTISNCTVSNAQIESGASSKAGGITATLSGGTISNCNVSSVKVNGAENIGGIVGTNDGSVKDCKVENSDVTSTSDYAGGICGLNTNNVSGCTTSGSTIKAVKEVAGGIAGKSETSISNNKVTGSHISAENYAGGIVGWATSGVMNNDVTNTDVTAKACAGGIVGDASGDGDNTTINISGCSVSGCKIVTDQYAAGIASISVVDIKDCHVKNTTVNSNEYVSAGLVCRLDGNIIVGDCIVENSEITSSGTHVGGAVGAMQETEHEGGNDACIFSNIQVSGTSVVGTDYVGGIFGVLNHYRSAVRAKVIDCRFSGTITGKDNVGGISGFAEGANIENCAVEADVAGSKFVGGILGIGEGYCEYVRSCSVRGMISATEKYAAGIAGTFYGTYIAYNYFIGNVSGADSDTMKAGEGLCKVSGSYFVRSTDDKSVPWRWEDNPYSRIYASACSDLVTDIASAMKERVSGGDKYYNFSNTFVAYGCTCPRLIWE